MLAALSSSGMPTTKEELRELVAKNDKQRFELTFTGDRIRARQGHSISVEGEWPEASPPNVLFHGTTRRFLHLILDEGLQPKARHHVHLSTSSETAQIVGGRRGTPIVLEVAAARMAADGFTFRRSSNGIWLTDHVPAPYLQVV